MRSFIGRKAEVHALENAYRAPGTTFVPVYGRRRVGKSELILHFAENKPTVYFLGKRAPAQLQIREFLTEVARALDEPLLADLSVEDWKTALETAMGRKRGKRKLVLVFDEFQWTVQASPELPSVLQAMLDGPWKARGDIMLILCGSFLGFMEKEVLGRGSPLFGRRHAQILLKPFSYREAGFFHPDWSVTERAKAYFICGGVPLYLKFFTRERSVEQNIETNFLSEFAALHQEPEFLLREELRELEKYYGILLALSAGSLAAGEIASRTGVPERSLHYYLQQLSQLGYVRRRYPLSGRKRVARHVRFAIDDPLLRFWFRFIYPHMSYITRADPSISFRNIVRPGLEAYFGTCFERLCREALPWLYQREGMHASFEVGEYWSKETQIDVVGCRTDGWVDLGECKWGAVGSRATAGRELSKKVRHYPNPQNATIQLRLFLGQRPRGMGAAGEFRVHSLDDLYAE